MSAYSDNLEKLKNILSKQAEVAIDWLTENGMIANPSKFQAIIFTKNKEPIRTTFSIKGKQIPNEAVVELLGIQIDEKLKFDKHTKEIIRKSAGQLNSLNRLKSYLSSESKKLAVNSFITSNFNYCPLIWNFSNANLTNKIEKVQERALRLIDNSQVSYEHLLDKYNKCTFKTKTHRLLATEIFKSLNHINPSYIGEIFQQNKFSRSERLKCNLKSQTFKRVKFGKKSLRVLGPILWNSLPNQTKTADSLFTFKTLRPRGGGTSVFHFFFTFFSF